MELARRLLDELMGPERNKMPNEKGSFGIRFTDSDVCKFSLVGFCPYQEFMNTKSDIGPCPCRYHEDNLKEQFELKGESYREEYERDFLTFLEGLVNDLERRFKRGKERLEVRPNDPSVTNVHSTNDETEEKRIILDLQLKEILNKIETCGEEGRIREAQELTIQADNLKAELDQLKGTVDYENPLHKLDKKMEVCTVCGAFLVMNDAPKRIGAHFEGRQHSGWVKVREAVESLRQKWSSYQRRGSDNSRKESSRYEHRNRDYDSDRDHYRRDSRDSRDSKEYRDSRDSRDYKDSRDSRDHRDHREYNSRDSRDSRSYKDSRDSRESREYRDSRDSRDRDQNSSLKRRNSDDSSSRESLKRPTYDNYIPGSGLDYELGEIVEEGEIPDTR